MYIVHAQRNDSVFQIVSLKNSIYSDSGMIRIGGKYQLDLIKIYPNAAVEKGVSIVGLNAKDSCFLKLNKRSHYVLYGAYNLNGLNISNNQQNEADWINKFGIYTIFCDACKKEDKFLLRLFVK